MGAIRDVPNKFDCDIEDVPSLSYTHFQISLKAMSPSVSQNDLGGYVEFDKKFGSKFG
jgi:hypothetical protein